VCVCVCVYIYIYIKHSITHVIVVTNSTRILVIALSPSKIHTIRN